MYRILGLFPIDKLQELGSKTKVCKFSTIFQKLLMNAFKLRMETNSNNLYHKSIIKMKKRSYK